MTEKSYGHAYLTSYGWTGAGAGLRKGAINRPLAITPKKNLGGLGKDRDDAFPFWDHLFTAASNAIKIKVSSDDEDGDATEDPSSRTDPEFVPLRRTTTGIISNRRPIHGTPASTSGSTTDAVTQGRPSLLATARREAAKRRLYAGFFRGPVLGPNDDLHSTPSSSQSSSVSTPAPEHVRDPDNNDIGEPKKNQKRESEETPETKEERRERKRLKKERKVARAATKAAKALAEETVKEKKNRLDDVDRKARKRRGKETSSEASSYSSKGRKQARRYVAGSEGDGLGATTRKKPEEEFAPSLNGQLDTPHRPSDLVLTTKKKRKRKDTP